MAAFDFAGDTGLLLLTTPLSSLASGGGGCCDLGGNNTAVATKMCAKMAFVMDSRAIAGRKDINIMHIFLIGFDLSELSMEASLGVAAAMLVIVFAFVVGWYCSWVRLRLRCLEPKYCHLQYRNLLLILAYR